MSSQPKLFKTKSLQYMVAVATPALILAACGGGGGGSGTTPTPSAAAVASSSSSAAAASSSSAAAAASSSSSSAASAAAVAKSWKAASLIETSSAGSAVAPDLAFDPSGNAIVVWQVENSGSFQTTWSNRFTKASGFGTAGRIESYTTGQSFAPSVKMDANGNAMVLWSQFVGSGSEIVYNRYTAGTGWGTTALIETPDSFGDFNPVFDIDSTGKVLAVWRKGNASENYDLASSRFTVGSGWSAANLIDASADMAFGVDVAFDPTGNAIAVWDQGPLFVRYDAWANRFTGSSGTWGTAVRIETNNASGASSTSGTDVAVDKDGNAIAVWSQDDGTRFNIWTNRYTPSGGWGTAVLLESNNAGSAGDPQIAFDANGNAIAVWQQSDGTRNNIWANRYTSGTGWGTPQLIETDNAGAAINPQIAFDASGNAFAVWQQSDGTRDNIWAVRFTSGTGTGSGWGTPFLLETSNAGAATLPRIAIDASGNALAVWQQSDGSRTNIWAARFD
jgi:hypothetical protein